MKESPVARVLHVSKGTPQVGRNNAGRNHNAREEYCTGVDICKRSLENQIYQYGCYYDRYCGQLDDNIADDGCNICCAHQPYAMNYCI